MSDKSAVTRQAISKHLRVLEEAGFVAGERRGREHIWRLRPQRLRDVHAQLDRLGRQWDDALERLRAFVEEQP
jgi:DNA-binding transcriptional ArsR family regulator